METVLAAFIIIFIIVFAALTLSDALIANQSALSVTWQEMEARTETRTQTNLEMIDTQIRSAGSEVDLTLRNTGTVRLIDFARWDVIVQYYDTNTPPTYYIMYLPYTGDAPLFNEWALDGIYLNAGQAANEVYEPGVFNPGEEAIIRVKLASAIGVGKAISATISTGDGIQVSTIRTRNTPPVLATNTALALTGHTTVFIAATSLQSTDVDTLPADLRYVITVPPTQGTLSLPISFTQVDIDEGRLNYTSSAGSADSFQFTVTDGTDTIGAYTFNIVP